MSETALRFEKLELKPLNQPKSGVSTINLSAWMRPFKPEGMLDSVAQWYFPTSKQWKTRHKMEYLTKYQGDRMKYHNRN